MDDGVVVGSSWRKGSQGKGGRSRRMHVASARVLQLLRVRDVKWGVIVRAATMKRP